MVRSGDYYVVDNNGLHLVKSLYPVPGEPHSVSDSTAMAECILRLQAELVADELLLHARNRVLNAIPECPEHGPQCVPHALEWIGQVQERVASLEALLRRLEWDIFGICTVCDSHRNAGHKPGCELAAHLQPEADL